VVRPALEAAFARSTSFLHVSHSETLVMERDETSPYWGFALALAVGVGASFWVGIIWAVIR